MSRGTTQQTRSIRPEATSRAAAITGKQRLAAARGDGGEDVAGVGPAGDDSLDHARKLSLVRTERARVQGAHR